MKKNISIYKKKKNMPWKKEFDFPDRALPIYRRPDGRFIPDIRYYITLDCYTKVPTSLLGNAVMRRHSWETAGRGGGGVGRMWGVGLLLPFYLGS